MLVSQRLGWLPGLDEPGQQVQPDELELLVWFEFYSRYVVGCPGDSVYVRLSVQSRSQPEIDSEVSDYVF